MVITHSHPYPFQWTSFANLVKLALTVILGFLLSFGPFLVNGQLFIVISRLFPVDRGLTHAYWAPNFWAMYCFLDRCLATLAKRMNPDFIVPEGSTSGLVQQSTFAFLPNVPPSATAILTIIIWLPVLYKLWKHPKGKFSPKITDFPSTSKIMQGDLIES
jgi:alpha-1,3-glucosyltransferase